MMNILSALHMLCGLIVLAEALNKLERSDLFSGRCSPRARLAALAYVLLPWRWTRAHLVLTLKVAGWACLAIGGAGALATPMLHLKQPTIQDLAVIGGFALLIVRSRIREGVKP